jgi:transcriptional regulator with XRE-family HTH domain
MLAFSRCGLVSVAQSLKVLGSRIRELRKRRGFSQEGLALAADIDRSFMGQVERGQRNVSFATLYRLAAVIGCDLADLCRDLPGIVILNDAPSGSSYPGSGMSSPALVLRDESGKRAEGSDKPGADQIR